MFFIDPKSAKSIIVYFSKKKSNIGELPKSLLTGYIKWPHTVHTVHSS